MITQTQWMQISQKTREKLREIFCIPRSSYSWVRDNYVVTDGVTNKDLEALTDEKMQDYSGVSGTSEKMLEECIKKIEKLPKLTEAKLVEAIEDIVPFKCSKCEFVGTSDKTLKFHIIKEHANG